MAKDPAFLFYYQDFLVGTDEFTNEQVGAYIRCLCIQAAKGGISQNHMIKICESSANHDVIKRKFLWCPEDGVYRNTRLFDEIDKRKKYCESRSKNKKGHKHKKNTSESHDKHMENENKDENEDSKEGGMGEPFHPTGLAGNMIQIFKESYPKYPEDADVDPPNCLQIAYKIARTRGWTNESVTNGKLTDVLLEWRSIVTFSKSDPWYSTRSISDFNKEFQRLIQKMNNGGAAETKRINEEKPRPTGNVSPGGFGNL